MYIGQHILTINPLAPKPSQLLADALALFGPNGEHWIKRARHTTTRPFWGLGFIKFDNFCAIGAIENVNTANESAAAYYLFMTTPRASGGHLGSIIIYNDHPERTFPEIKAWFTKAIALAKADNN